MRVELKFLCIGLLYLAVSCNSEDDVMPDEEIEETFLLLKVEKSFYNVKTRHEIINFSYDENGLLVEELRVVKQPDTDDSTSMTLTYEYRDGRAVSCMYSKHGRRDVFEYENNLLISRKSYSYDQLDFTELMEYDNSNNLIGLIGIADNEFAVDVESSNNNVKLIHLTAVDGEPVDYNPILYDHHTNTLNPLQSLPYRHEQERGVPGFFSKNIISKESERINGIVELKSYTEILEVNSLKYPVKVQQFDSGDNLISETKYTYSYE